jgi:uncharacterized protein YxeA
MNNKIIAGIIVVLIILAGAFFLMRSKSGDVASESQTADSQTQVQSEKSSIKSLLASGSTRKCTYSVDQDGYKSEGTIYVANNKMRGDFTALIDGKETMSHMINDSATSYMWTDGVGQGMKFSISPEDVNSDQYKSAKTGAVNLDQNYDFSCDSWVVDTSKFELPSNVQFSELPKIPSFTPETAGSPESSLDTKEAQQAICNSLTGAAKDACLKGLEQ